MSPEPLISDDNLNRLLFEIAKDYRKRTHQKGKAEIIIVGGSAIIAAYHFRRSSTDIDALVFADSELFDSIRKVGDDNGLPPSWFNDDFSSTESYSPHLVEFSAFYKEFCHCLQVRVISGAYLLAMKLQSFRIYKDDSDVVGIYAEERSQGHDISEAEVQKAYHDLYGEKAQLSEEALSFYRGLQKIPDLGRYYAEIKGEEGVRKAKLIELSQTDRSHIKTLSKSELRALLEKVKKQ